MMGNSMKKRLFVIFLIGFCANSNMMQFITLTNASAPSSSYNSTNCSSPTVIPFNASITSLIEVPGIDGWINRFLNLWFIFSRLFSGAILMIIFLYLHNVTLANECVLVYLYKDMISIVILIRIVMVFTRIIRLHEWSSLALMAINPLPAKVLSFIIVLLAFSLMISLNIISFIRLYIAKTMILDPWESDEYLGENVFRLIEFGIPFGVSTVLYTFEIYPKIYYWFISGEQNIPKSSEY